jgi:hypothetical protein
LGIHGDDYGWEAKVECAVMFESTSEKRGAQKAEKKKYRMTGIAGVT